MEDAQKNKKKKNPHLDRNLSYILLLGGSGISWSVLQYIQVYFLFICCCFPESIPVHMLNCRWILTWYFQKLQLVKIIFLKKNLLISEYLNIFLPSYTLFCIYCHLISSLILITQSIWLDSPELGSDLIIPNNIVVFKTLVKSMFIPFHFMRKITTVRHSKLVTFLFLQFKNYHVLLPSLSTC